MNASRYLMSCAIAFLVIAPLAVHAQTYWFKGDEDLSSVEKAHHLSAPTHLQYVFGSLNASSTYDAYTFQAKKGDIITFALRTESSATDFQPWLVLLGPGLPQPAAKLPFTIGESNGAFISKIQKEQRDEVTERNWLTSFFVGPRIDTIAPQDGAFALAVVTDAETGRYVLTVGNQDLPVNFLDVHDLANRIIGFFRAIFRRY